mgnify:CR=1 FL=1
MSIDKSTKAARGTVQCENTNINLLDIHFPLTK